MKQLLPICTQKIKALANDVQKIHNRNKDF
jgi:hypothetical protein